MRRIACVACLGAALVVAWPASAGPDRYAPHVVTPRTIPMIKSASGVPRREGPTSADAVRRWISQTTSAPKTASVNTHAPGTCAPRRIARFDQYSICHGRSAPPCCSIR